MIPLRKDPDWKHWENVARNAIASTASFYGRNLQVDVEEQSLVLSGVVKSLFQREKVYQAVKKAVGIIPVINEIEIAVE
jgi:osmotically-inducible protein OsmY